MVRYLRVTMKRQMECITYALLINLLLTTEVINHAKGQAPSLVLRFTSGSAAQSSDGTKGNDVLVPSKAIDSNARTCSRTQEENGPWWRAELGNEFEVLKVIITNDILASQAEKLEGAVITIGSSFNDPAIATTLTECGTVSQEQASKRNTPIEINCGSNTYGNYVYITIPGELKTLGLCEVNLEGLEAPIIPTATPAVTTTTPSIPTTTPTFPATTPTVPITTPTIPTTTPIVPTTATTNPTTAPTFQTTTPINPTTPLTIPTTKQVVTTTAPIIPTTAPIVPTTPPNIPTTTPAVTTTTPTILPTTPTVPTTTPTVPAPTPTVPTTTPTIPTTIPAVTTPTPTIPTKAQTVPTTTQTVPTTTPTIPATTPNVPTTTPNVPTTTPNVPTTTPNVPTTTPTIRTARLTVPSTTPKIPITSPSIPTTKTNTVYSTDYDITPDVTSAILIGGESDSKPIVNSCPMEVTDVNGFILTWSQTLASEEDIGSLEKCADYSSKPGEPRGFRVCSQVENVAHWNPAITNECFEDVEKNGRIERLAMTTVTSENAESISSDLVYLTTDSGDLIGEELASAAEVIEIITLENYTSPMVITNVFQTVDNLLEIDQEQFRRAHSSNSTSTKLLMALETEIAMLTNNGSNYTFYGENMAIMILQLPRQAFANGFKFTSVSDEDLDDDSSKPSDYNNNGTYDTRQAAIYLPNVILDFIEDDMIGVSFVTYENSKLFQSRTPHLLVGRKIISATVSNVHMVGLPNEEPVVPSFISPNMNYREQELVVNEYATEYNRPQCVFWNFTADHGVGDWSTAGCRLASYYGEEAICHCNHLTNFAVLLDVSGGEIHNLTLDLVSKIGCAISIAALIITIVTYLNIRNLRTKQPQRIILHLSFSLLGLYSVFLIGIEQTRSYFGCIVVAGLIHYFTLTSTCWMAVEAVNMYFLFVRVMDARVSNFLIKASLFGWGLPMVIVTLVAGLDHTQYYNDHHCFLRPGVVFSFAVILIVILLLMFNSFIFFIVTHRLTCGRRRTQRTNIEMAKEGLKRLQNVIVISVLLGLTWTFGFLTAIESARFELQLLFCIFNSLQGLFLFLLFCVRPKEVRFAWSAWFTGSTIRKMSLGTYLNSRKRSSAVSLTRNAIYKTGDSRGNLNVSLGNLSHISGISALQTAQMISENNIIVSNNEDNRLSLGSATDNSMSNAADESLI